MGTMIQEKARTPPVAGRRRNDGTRTRAHILAIAMQHFADRGLDGARMDEIAEIAGVNKNLLYHHFGSKDQLFNAVLENVYEQLRSRQNDLRIREMDPVPGMRRLVEMTGRVWMDHPDFLRILNSENLHEAKHVRVSRKILDLYNPLLETIGVLLQRGFASGEFRKGIDAKELYISISALTAHYVSNFQTFEAILGVKLMGTKRKNQRLKHASEMILRYLSPP